MSGRIGTCINCGETDRGIYLIDVIRGWTTDKYDFNVKICEKCLDKITENWKLDGADRSDCWSDEEKEEHRRLELEKEGLNEKEKRRRE